MITDMSQGRPAAILWRFTIPMLLSAVFQQLYNVADSVVAGRFVGEDALAAVGASFPITTSWPWRWAATRAAGHHQPGSPRRQPV
ncbi:MAG: MATE family efflux transporter [Ruthenibacterium lactatiformans]